MTLPASLVIRSLRVPALLCALSAFASEPARGQGGACGFQVDPQLSSLTFSGTTDIGPIVGNPDTAALAGTLLVDLATAGNPVSTGQLSGGDLEVVGGLHAFVPNIFPFLPPLASVDVADLHLAAGSVPFLGSDLGTFATDVVVTVLSGTADVVPLVGDPSTIDTKGTVSDPAPASGTLTKAGDLLTLTLTFSTTVDLSDPAAGITGSLTLSGVLVGTHDLASGCATSLFTDTGALSLAAGGTAGLLLDAGPAHGGSSYRVLAGTNGRALRGALQGSAATAALDPLLAHTLASPLAPHLEDFSGILDGVGRGAAAFVLPPGGDPGLVGVRVSFAFAAGLGGGTGGRAFQSNSVSLELSL